MRLLSQVDSTPIHSVLIYIHTAMFPWAMHGKQRYWLQYYKQQILEAQNLHGFLRFSINQEVFPTNSLSNGFIEFFNTEKK